MINYDRLYDYRFRGVSQASRQQVWDVLALDIYERMGRPAVVLDPAAGRGEFLQAVPAADRWAVDRVAQHTMLDPTVTMVEADIFDVDLPDDHFDGVFVSNFLEHLPSQDRIAILLDKLRVSMTNGGRIAILGPNFKYCAKTYFDCADHTLALTHVSVQEHLAAAGFTLTSTVQRYIPFSFRSVLPTSAKLTQAYLRLPPARRFLGKQFLVIAER
jgi:ubiquinone/menaquinone biosynthesis C-methylase UbiE